MNAQVSIETVEPKKANHYLATLLDCQRKLREGHIIKLGTEIENGNWHLTGDALIFVKGRLANGQHRLHALVLADKACQFIVLRTDDEEVYKVLDSGIGRTVGDAIGNMGITLAKEVAAIAKLVLFYDNDVLTMRGAGGGGRASRITRSHVIDYIEEHQDELEKQAHYCTQLRANKNIVSPVLSGALLHLGKRSGKGDIETFITNLYLGGSQDAAFDLRERLIRNKDSKLKLNRDYIFGLMIKSYKSFLNGTRPGTLKIVEGEGYPKMP